MTKRPRAFALALAAAAAAALGQTASSSRAAEPAAVAPGTLIERGFDFARYGHLLKQYTDAEGRVDYESLRARDAATVDQLAASLAASGPTVTPALYSARGAPLAYYLCAYNLLVWKNILDQRPARVDDKGFAFFQQPKYRVDGHEVSLDELEKRVIRPRFKDGRIHFALNCASGGCPKLPREPFLPQQVEQQLDREARRFINEKRNVDLDVAGNKLRLSMIFKWYRDDFAPSDPALIDYLNKYRMTNVALPKDAKIEFVDYDWRLNDKRLPLR